MKKFIINPATLKIGDITLTREDAPISKTIRKSLSCDYSHVLLYVGHFSCIHADGDGVHSINMQRVLFDDESDIKVIRHSNPDLPQETLDKACKYARSRIGTEYSTADAVRSGISRKLNKPPKLDPKYQFCSRLVAESYAYAEIYIHDDPAWCTPADILESNQFVEIYNVTKIATQAEIEFSKNEEKNTISKQTKITNSIMSAAKSITGRDIQTFDELLIEVIKNPKIDNEVASLIEQSGYLKIWADDIIKSPYRYFKHDYEHMESIDSVDLEFIETELGMARRDMTRFEEMRSSLVNLIRNFGKRETILQHIVLYQVLWSLAHQRVELFEWLLSKKTAPL